MRRFVVRICVIALLSVASASVANASTCKVVVTATGGVIGGVVGLVVDIFTFGGSGGAGTVLGAKAGTAAGRGAAEGVCPDDRADMVEEVSLVRVIDRCLNDSWYPYNPLWNHRDFCLVVGNPFFTAGGDVSIKPGRQIDHHRIVRRLSGVILSVGKAYQKAGKLSKDAYGRFRSLADALHQCDQTFSATSGDDYCRIRATVKTASYFKVQPGVRTVDSLTVIRAVRNAVRHLAGDLEATPHVGAGGSTQTSLGRRFPSGDLDGQLRLRLRRSSSGLVL